MRRILLSLALWALATAAHAQNDLASEARRLQEDLVSQRAIAIARERRLTSAGDDVVLARLDTLEKGIRAKARDLARTRSERDAARAELVPVIAERDRLKDEFARRDTAYAAEIAEYQRQIGALVKTDNPKLTEALQQFADGDRVGAFPVIEAIMRAEIKAQEAATAERSAAQLRQLATLASDMRDRGEKSAADVIAIWEEAQGRTPGWNQGWRELNLLYVDAGRLADARRAADQAIATASSEREKAIGLAALAEVLELEGDLPGALKRYEESLAALRARLAKAPGDAGARRDVALALFKMSDLLRHGDSPQWAADTAREALTLLSALAAETPDDPRAAREATGGKLVLGQALTLTGDAAGSRKLFAEALAEARARAQGKPIASPEQRDLVVTLMNLAETYSDARDYPEATRLYEESLAIFRGQSAADPGNAQARRDLALAVIKAGKMASIQGDEAAARRQFEEALAILRPLMAADPRNMEVTEVAAEAYAALIITLTTQDDLPAAKAVSEEYLAQERRLIGVQPTSAQIAMDLAEALLSRGDVLIAAKDLDGATSAYNEGLGIWSQRLAGRPDDKETRRRLATRLLLIGDSYLGADSRGQAVTAYRYAGLVLKEWIALDPRDKTPQRQLAGSLAFIGRVELSGDHYDEARAAYEEAAAVFRKATGDELIEASAELRGWLFELGEIAVLKDDFPAAERWYRESLDLALRLAKAGEGRPDLLEAVADSQSRLGSMRLQAGDRAGALPYQRGAVAAYRERAAKAPALDLGARREMALALSDLGEGETTAGNGAEGLALRREAVAMLGALAKAKAGDERAATRYARYALSLAKATDARADWSAAVAAMEASAALQPLGEGDKATLEAARARAAGAPPPGATP